LQARLPVLCSHYWSPYQVANAHPAASPPVKPDPRPVKG